MAERLRNSINMRTGSVCWKEITPMEVVRFAFNGILPPHGLQPLLHEFAAHYWCANTPVHRAIQMRWLDYMRRTGMLLASDAFSGENFEEMVRRFDPEIVAIAAELSGVEACLRPFAEGIATFSEFNFYPPAQRRRKSVPYLTQITMLLAQMNADAAGDKRAGIGSITRARESLQAARTDKATIHRKGDLLCHPVGLAGMEECYLLGYALIKTIHDNVRRKYGDQLDGEAIISFLIYHVYWDWRIVDLLLSSDRIRPQSVMELLESTLRGLFDSDFLQRYDAWDQWLISLEASGNWESGRHNEMPFHGLTTEQIQAIKRKGAAFVVDRLAPNGAQGMDLVLSIPREMLDYCALYATDVWVQIQDPRKAQLFAKTDNGPVFVAEMDLFEPAPPQTSEGSLTVYGTFRPAGEFTLLISLRFAKSHILLGSRGPGGDRADWLRKTEFWLKRNAVHHDDLDAFCEAAETVIAGVDRETKRNIFDDVVQKAGRDVIQSYRELLRGYGGAGKALIDFASKIPADDNSGVRTLFDKGSLFDAYSLLGLSCSFTSDRAELASLLKGKSYDLEALISCAKDIERKSGVKLIDVDSNGRIQTAF